MRRLAAPVLLGAAVMVPTAASAAWSASGSGASAVSATTMTNATGFSAACASKSVVKLTWTISPDPFVEHYDIVRSGGGGGTTIRVPRTDSTVNDNPPPGTAKTPHTYSYTIRAGSTAHAWVTPTLGSTTTVALTNSTCTAS